MLSATLSSGLVVYLCIHLWRWDFCMLAESQEHYLLLSRLYAKGIAIIKLAEYLGPGHTTSIPFQM